MISAEAFIGLRQLNCSCLMRIVFDTARILRAIRVAARLGFRFTRETAHSVKDFNSLVSRLDKVIMKKSSFVVVACSMPKSFSY